MVGVEAKLVAQERRISPSNSSSSDSLLMVADRPISMLSSSSLSDLEAEGRLLLLLFSSMSELVERGLAEFEEA